MTDDNSSLQFPMTIGLCRLAEDLLTCPRFLNH